jgi:hypothetical protein
MSLLVTETELGRLQPGITYRRTIEEQGPHPDFVLLTESAGPDFFFDDWHWPAKGQSDIAKKDWRGY